MPSPRPRITLHFAQSLDGRIALGPGRPRAILSSPEGFVAAHRARAEHDAVLVGIHTVLLDDPQLTVRACPGRQPVRVVLDSALRLPVDRRMALGAGAGEARVIAIGAEGRATPEAQARLQAAGVEVVVVAASPDGRVALAPALAALEGRSIGRLLVEGGAAVLSSFARERLVDSVTVEIAPCVLGAPGLTAFAELGAASFGDAVHLGQLRVEQVGPNLLLRGEVADGSAA